MRELQGRIGAGTIDPQWLQAHVQPDGAALSRHAAAAWAHALRPDSPLAARLGSDPAVVAVSRGPATTRVVFDGRPYLSVVVQDDVDPPVIVDVVSTSCGSCTEPWRWVADLVDDLARRGHMGHRLIPGLELHLEDHLAENPGLRGSYWPASLESRLQDDASIAHDLADARVVSEQDGHVTLSFTDGSTDVWSLIWHEQRWQVDYSQLSSRSPLWFSAGQARQWRRGSHRRQTALATWEPSWRQAAGDSGQIIAHDAVGAMFDPRDGSVLVVLLDIGRILGGVVRLDPDLRVVQRRYPLPAPTDGRHLVVGPWVEKWRMALSPEGELLAVTTPDKVVILDLESGSTRSGSRRREVSALSWARGQSEALLVGEPRGALTIAGASERTLKLPGRPVLVDQDDEGLIVALSDGTVHLGAPGELAVEHAATVCCGALTDAVRSVTTGELLLSCDASCDHAAERRLAFATESTMLPGHGSYGRAASWSPTGDHFTTGAPADEPGLLIWDARRNEPVARLGEHPIRGVDWSPDGTRLLAVTATGEVWLWDAALARRAQPWPR